MAPFASRFPPVLVACCTAAMVLAACGDKPPPSPSPLPAASPEATAARADTIRVAFAATPNPVAFGPLSNASSPSRDPLKAGVVNTFIHDALYRYDEHAQPTPSLARSCDPSADGRTITCHLIDASFQNGHPVTADDVVFTYGLMNASWDDGSGDVVCVANTWVPPTNCLTSILESASKVDDMTVAFRLKRPYAPFFTNILPAVWIDSEAVVRHAYEAFRATSAAVDPPALLASSNDLLAEAHKEGGDCEPLVQDAAQLVDRAGLLLPDRNEFTYLEHDGFAACDYAAALGSELGDAAAALETADETTAIAHVYPDLAFGRDPMGAGPYTLAAYRPGKDVTLKAWQGFHGGPPATKTFVFTIYSDEDAAAKAVAEGNSDWVELFNPTPFHWFDGVARVRTGHPVLPGYQGLHYNLRDGRLFSDLRLRQALELCIDKATMVDSATDGQGIATYADVAPNTWAHDDALPKPAQDVGAAKAKIEAAGWTIGDDAIYAKGARRLAAKLWVRADRATRIKFAELVSSQARDCGIDLSVVTDDFRRPDGGGLYRIVEWKNLGPDGQPFDLYLSGFVAGWDPAADTFDSRAITNKASGGDNFGGFADARVDKLLDRIESTYDPAERAAMLREYQEILAEQQPELFAWNDARGDGVAVGLRSTTGALDLEAPMWMAHPERLVLDLPARP